MQDSIHPQHLLIAAETLSEVFRAAQPADSILRERFHRHKNAGAKDRAKISGLVYAVLRNYFFLRALLGESASALELCVAQLARTGVNPPTLRELDTAALARRVAAFDTGRLDAAQRHNLPGWLWHRLLRDFGEAEGGALAIALNKPASVDLRVNTLKATRDAAQGQLAQDGIASMPTPRSPLGLRLEQRAALQATRALRDGWIEPQDEGSQLLALHVDPRPGETVVDFCAGAGGKALALGALMQDRGALHAFDVSRARLERFAPRLQRSGLSIVRTQVLRDERDPRLTALAGRCDAVLVDAPCSATGTLRRNPELRLREPDLPKLRGLQGSILREAAKLVRVGGRLVYATCSVLREENEDMVAEFLREASAFSRGPELHLWPHRDGTDGFYAATLIRSL